MIFASILAKYAMPEWLRKALIWCAVVLVVIGCAIAYKRHLIGVGVAQEAARRDLIDERNRGMFNTAFAKANGKVLAAQTALDDTKRTLKENERKLDHEKANSVVLQSRLASGAERLRVALHNPAANAGDGKTFEGPGVGDLGTPSADFAYLAPRVGVFLEQLRASHNEAADRLDACIYQYDALKLAVDRLAEPEK